MKFPRRGFLHLVAGAAALPIVALSAHALVGEREKAFAAGCDAFDAKPIQFERLLATLRRLGRAAGDGAGRS